MHLFKIHAQPYLKAGFSVIPDRFRGKTPLIKGWNEYSFRLPTKKDVREWEKAFTDSNIALCMGEASGIVALDFDCVDERIIEVVKELLPDSPCEKVGAKGWTRFFQFKGEVNNNVSFNGKVVVEILANSKKTTVPPSVHPNGDTYTWTGKSLLEVDKEDLPALPPRLLESIRHELKLAFPNTEVKGHKLVNGRNDALSKYCSKLIKYSTPMDEAIRDLIKYDKENHDIPLFTDISEHGIGHTEEFTNALKFYANHLDSFNRKAMRDNTEFEKPTTAHAISYALQQEAQAERLKKLISEAPTRRLVPELPKVEDLPGALAAIMKYILNNSPIPQYSLTMGATLSLGAIVLTDRFVFEQTAPNMYILNVSPPGSGKDQPQKEIIDILQRTGLGGLLGAANYSSYAGFLDSNEEQKNRIDIIDEAGTPLKRMMKPQASHDEGFGDAVTEIWGSSTKVYLGRKLAGNNRKGHCIRPHVTQLFSTTPAALEDAITQQAVQKGLVPRILLFEGDSTLRSKRLSKKEELDPIAINTINSISRLNVEENPKYALTMSNEAGEQIKVPQRVYELKSTEEAEIRLQEVHSYFDELRVDKKTPELVKHLIARCYQQVLKITTVLTLFRTDMGASTPPKVIKKDVDIAYDIMLHCLHNMKLLVRDYAFEGWRDKLSDKFIKKIKKAGKKGMTKSEFTRKTTGTRQPERDAILKDLVTAKQIIMPVENGETMLYYIGGEKC
tara:strand:+ start:10315 stop:12501 length:2187 start_codon:yes stop_codon:yes gene_type:complete